MTKIERVMIFRFVAEKLVDTLRKAATEGAVESALAQRAAEGKSLVTPEQLRRRSALALKVAEAHVALVLQHMEECHEEDVELTLSMAYMVIGGSYAVLNGGSLNDMLSTVKTDG